MPIEKGLTFENLEVPTEGGVGPQGLQGDQGPAGAQGDQGPAGAQGDQQGDQGPAGAQGDQGPAGAQGDQGPAGAQGDQGPQGPAGPPGGSLPWYNVKNYGAVGDGVVDDTAAIIAAYNACGYGSTLYFPASPDPYLISSKIRVTKRINIVGEGFWSQIYQTGEDHIFHIDYAASGESPDKTPAGMIIENLALASMAVNSPHSLIFFDMSPYNVIRNIYMKGGYYGIYLYGALGNAFYNLFNFGTFSEPTSVNQYWVFGERAYSRSINHTSFFNPVLQTGTRGIYITDNSSEGGVGIWGGLVEGLTTKGIYLSGITEGFTIDRVHTEGDGVSGIEIVSCRNGEIANCYNGNPQGIVLTSAQAVKIHGGYASYITVDSSSEHIDIDGVHYGFTLDVRGAVTKMRNMVWAGGASLGGYGMYQSEAPAGINSNGDMELWAGGVPVGYAAIGSVIQETTIRNSGASSAKLTVPGGANWNALRYDLPVWKFKYGKKSITVRAWVYKPAGGANPRIAIYYNSWAGNILGPDFSPPVNTWTPIVCTFNVSALAYSNIFVIVGSYDKPLGAIVYIDDVLISEVQF